MNSFTSDSKPLSCDWVWSNTSNVHMCNDRRWFTNYTPFESRAGDIYSDKKNLAIAGVGTVVLPVKKSPTRSGANAHGKIVLHNVLHCPSACCNVFAYPGGNTENDGDYVISFRGDEKRKGSIKRTDGSPVAYFDLKGRLYRIRLSGPPYGPITGHTVLTGNTVLMINVCWSKTEIARYNKHLEGTGKQIKAMQPNTTSATSDISLPYTDAEKKWLKEHFMNEYHFLQCHGLSIYEDEDREEGRAMLRALMKDDREVDSEMADDEPGSGFDSDDLEGHMADYHFDEKTLDWIEKHYGNPMNFMFSYGLKFYDDDDCAEAKLIAHAMMRD